jgi:uncharacterized protein YcnI
MWRIIRSGTNREEDPMFRTLMLASTMAAGLFGFASAASAHALMIEKNVAAGAWHIMQIGIPHGCTGTPTHTIRIKVPDGLTLVRPERKAGWTLKTTMRKLEKPIVAEGVTYTETIDEMIWTGGNLGDMEFDRFGALIKFPNEAGKTLYFKTIQQCEKGEHRWVEIPEGGKKWGEYKEPAPFVVLYDPKAKE